MPSRPGPGSTRAAMPATTSTQPVISSATRLPCLATAAVLPGLTTRSPALHPAAELQDAERAGDRVIAIPPAAAMSRAAASGGVPSHQRNETSTSWVFWRMSTTSRTSTTPGRGPRATACWSSNAGAGRRCVRYVAASPAGAARARAAPRWAAEARSTRAQPRWRYPGCCRAGQDGGVPNPREWTVEPADVLLADGTIAVIRPLRDDDLDAVLALHEYVSEDTLRLRFFSANRAAGPKLRRPSVRRGEPGHGLARGAGPRSHRRDWPRPRCSPPTGPRWRSSSPTRTAVAGWAACCWSTLRPSAARTASRASTRTCCRTTTGCSGFSAAPASRSHAGPRWAR